MTNRHDIVACARQFIGVRFAHQGRSEHGLDCLGVLLLTADRAGLVFGAQTVQQIDVPNYGMRPDTELLRRKLDRFLVPIGYAEIAPADIILLKVNGSPQHLAIICDYPMQDELGMVHAYAPAGKVVEHRYDRSWRRQTYAAFRLPHVAGSGA